MWIIFPLYMVYVHKPSGLQTGFVAPHGAPNRGEPIYIFQLSNTFKYLWWIIFPLFICILYIYVCVCSIELYQHDSIADYAWEVILGFEAPLIVLHTHAIYHETKNYGS